MSTRGAAVADRGPSAGPRLAASRTNTPPRTAPTAAVPTSPWPDLVTPNGCHTVPAMLTPGEYVVNRSAVARLGVGFFEAINNLSAPAQALAGRALAGIQGFASGGLVQPASRSLPRPSLPEGTPTRTVRVELSSGQQKVNATVDARDEARLLQLLDAARARTA